MFELRNYQNKYVNKLKELMISLFNQKKSRLKLIFKAPTGAGKTVMASKLLEDITYELPSNYDCAVHKVCFIWISPNQLYRQSCLSMQNFFSQTRSLRPMLWESCNPNDGLKPGDVLFLNWQSINSNNNILIRDNEQNRNLQTLVSKTKNGNDTHIVVVIDEEHLFANEKNQSEAPWK